MNVNDKIFITGRISQLTWDLIILNILMSNVFPESLRLLVERNVFNPKGLKSVDKTTFKCNGRENQTGFDTEYTFT